MIPVISLRGILPPKWPFHCYVGRELKFCGKFVVNLPAHLLANPFTMAKDTPANRREALAKYEAWLAERPKLDALLWEVWGDSEAGHIPLACWCANWDGQSEPAPLCHAVIISKFATKRWGGS